ncbi:hypothetical protein [Roseinatronobacter alkalisoli]|uniref:Uncharacterized protein n=1 Tax=Roseinatronobacter alkalisoli TaxID=3028235 RepID=A0ABT5TEN0_9RHOB|nr:hypothetical protein [Roseinatronobacter sp. HJB301]MDD7973461.1 hypothetical protein [Roseinatronobacter sp. HJB301]
MIRAAILLGVLSMANPAMGQSFSCNMGTRPTCLGFGETACSSSGKCVNQNAVCFDSFQCDYRGFTCRSNVVECLDRHECLLRDHNTLVDEYNGLLDTHSRLVRDHNALISDHRDLRASHSDLIDQHRRNLEFTRQLQRDLDNVEGCLILARTLNDAQECIP